MGKFLAAHIWQRFRGQTIPTFGFTVALLLVILAGGLLGVRTFRIWHSDVVSSNMSLVSSAANRLAADARHFLQTVPLATDEQGRDLVAMSPDSLDLQLALMSTQIFGITPGLKGGFWIPHIGEFLGYANPWSPPPVPTYGPPPRSYTLIRRQVEETCETGQGIVRLHELQSVSVSSAVFPLATEPVWHGEQLVAVAWARIHIERDLPLRKLGHYLQIAALVAISAFIVSLVAAIHQRRETRSLNQNLQLIEQCPTHRLTRRRGVFGSIREAINDMLNSLEQENSRRRSLEAQLHEQDKMAALGHLLTAVSHEVKTPLAILKTRVQIWQRDLKRFSRETGQAPPLSDESLQIALREINRLSDLLRKLVSFSRPVRVDLMRPLEPDDLIQHTVLFIKPRLVQQRIDLDMDLSAADVEILGDPDALHQVFLNILTNALDFMKDGGRLYVASRVDGGGGELVIDFIDDGPGLSGEAREKAFDPFFSERRGGTGLGLSISHEIVMAHHGTILFVDPEGGEGGHCRVTLPLHGNETETS